MKQTIESSINQQRPKSLALRCKKCHSSTKSRKNGGAKVVAPVAIKPTVGSSSSNNGGYESFALRLLLTLAHEVTQPELGQTTPSDKQDSACICSNKRNSFESAENIPVGNEYPSPRPAESMSPGEQWSTKETNGDSKKTLSSLAMRLAWLLDEPHSPRAKHSPMTW